MKSMFLPFSLLLFNANPLESDGKWETECLAKEEETLLLPLTLIVCAVTHVYDLSTFYLPLRQSSARIEGAERSFGC